MIQYPCNVIYINETDSFLKKHITEDRNLADRKKTTSNVAWHFSKNITFHPFLLQTEVLESNHRWVDVSCFRKRKDCGFSSLKVYFQGGVNNFVVMFK